MSKCIKCCSFFKFPFWQFLKRYFSLYFWVVYKESWSTVRHCTLFVYYETRDGTPVANLPSSQIHDANFLNTSAQYIMVDQDSLVRLKIFIIRKIWCWKVLVWSEWNWWNFKSYISLISRRGIKSCRWEAGHSWCPVTLRPNFSRSAVELFRLTVANKWHNFSQFCLPHDH